jgi:hypothetical protein
MSVVAGAGCPICASTRSEPLLERRGVPVWQNAVYPDAEAARAAVLGDLDFQRCAACGFAWNAVFEAGRLDYAPAYENRQSLSPAFQAHLRARAEACLALVEDRAFASFVEVGCGQGDFLVVLAETAGGRGGLGLTGFDPAWRGGEGEGPSGARIFRRRFDQAALVDQPPPGLIVARHVIEHIADPVGFLADLRRCAGPQTRLVIETPDVDWIRRTGALHDLFYEHCSLFSLGALDQALGRAGFLTQRLERVFDDQYLWAEATIAPDAAEGVDLDAYRRRWLRALQDAAARGPVVVWGAGAKGASFVQMLDPDARLITAVVDINPAKQDRRQGGGGHRVLAPEAAAALSPRSVFVMNPAYADEITRYVRENDWTAEIVIVR